MTQDTIAPRMAELEAKVQEMEAHTAELRARLAEAQMLLTRTTAERDRFQELYRRALDGARVRERGTNLPSVEEVAAQREGLALAQRAEIVERALERARVTHIAERERDAYTQGSLPWK